MEAGKTGSIFHTGVIDGSSEGNNPNDIMSVLCNKERVHFSLNSPHNNRLLNSHLP